MSEHNEQATFVDYVLWTYLHHADFIRPLFIAVPNGMWAGGDTYRKRATVINKLKAEGFMPGVADILYLQPRGDHPFLAIEMKTPQRAKEKDSVSEEQKAFLNAAYQVKAAWYVCYGADAAIRAFDEYMALPEAVGEKKMEEGAEV